MLTQTYTNWELLHFDDGSSDESTHIAQSYANKYPVKVRYLKHEGHINKGPGATRNLGLRKSKGKYIATLDADDVWLPNKLQEQVSIMESYPEKGMVYGDTKAWYSWTGNIKDKELEYYGHNRILRNSLRLNTVILYCTPYVKLGLSWNPTGGCLSKIQFIIWTYYRRGFLVYSSITVNILIFFPL